MKTIRLEPKDGFPKHASLSRLPVWVKAPGGSWGYNETISCIEDQLLAILFGWGMQVDWRGEE